MSERHPALEEIDLLWEAEVFRNGLEIEQAHETESIERQVTVRKGEK